MLDIKNSSDVVSSLCSVNACSNQTGQTCIKCGSWVCPEHQSAHSLTCVLDPIERLAKAKAVLDFLNATPEDFSKEAKTAINQANLDYQVAQVLKRGIDRDRFFACLDILDKALETVNKKLEAQSFKH
jgi:hypothetical protein